jgi:hypothetical protein
VSFPGFREQASCREHVAIGSRFAARHVVARHQDAEGIVESQFVEYEADVALVPAGREPEWYAACPECGDEIVRSRHRADVSG